MKPIDEMSTEDLLNLSTEEQANAFMYGIETPDGEKASEASPDLEVKADKPADAVTDKVDAVITKEEPVILAKDGKNTIPYSELESARERERAADLRARELEDALKSKDQLITDLQAAKTLDAETGGTEEQQKVLEEYEGDYPELMEDLKPHLEGMIQKGIEIGIKSFKAEMAKELEPIKQKAEQADKRAQTDDENAWVKVQNDFFQVPENLPFKENPILYDYMDNAVKTVANDEKNISMTYPEILAKAREMVTNEIEKMQRAILGVKPDTAIDAKDVAAKAEAVIAGVKEDPPISLSDVPGSASAHHDEAGALANMSTLSKLDKLMSLSPDKIEDLINRSV